MTPTLKSRAIWVVMCLICCSPLVVWMASVQHPLAYLRWGGLPPGQQLYLFSKLAGLFALCLFWMQCLLALARRAPMLPGFPTSDPLLHKRLGTATALMILAHVVMFIIATSARTGHAAWDMLLPSFAHGYYKFYISLGVIAFWLVCLTVFAGWRASRGQPRWKAVHMLWPVVFGLVFLHAFAIGTESRYGAMRYLVLFLVASLVIAGTQRLLRSHRRNNPHPTQQRPEPGVAQ